MNVSTGVQCILFVTRGTSNFVLQGTYFTTEGIVDFIPKVLKLDPQDICSRMEGFALQDLKGLKLHSSTQLYNLD